MDLKLKEVAELLNVPENVILEALSESNTADRMPAYLINGQYYFNRGEIERWVLRRKNDQSELENTSVSGGGSRQFNLYRALHKGTIVYDVPAKNKEEAIRNTIQMVSKSLELDAEGITDLLLDRERIQSTALGNGIALPHTRDFLLNRGHDIVVISYLKEPIDYDALDDQPVSILIFLFASDDKKHLHLLSKIAHLAHRQDALDYLRSRPSKEQALEYIREWESTLKKT